MTLMLDLTTDLEALLNRRAAREGEDAKTVALRLLADTLMNEEAEQASSTGRSMADLFAGRLSVASSSSEAFSENGGPRFAEYLAQKHGHKETQL